jgi:hypothetical protein
MLGLGLALTGTATTGSIKLLATITPTTLIAPATLIKGA